MSKGIEHYKPCASPKAFLLLSIYLILIWSYFFPFVWHMNLYVDLVKPKNHLLFKSNKANSGEARILI